MDVSCLKRCSLKFEIGDDVDKKLVNVLFHDFIKCENAFDQFFSYAGDNIMGNKDSSIKLNSYNAYSEFIAKLYEFYAGCFKREFKSTKNIEHEKLDFLMAEEVEKLLRNKRNAIMKGYAPDWESDITYYQVEVPNAFGKDFRDVRNNTSHVDYRRAGGNRIELMDFYKKYHKFVYLLYYSALFAWSGKTHKDHKIEHVESFDFLLIGN